MLKKRIAIIIEVKKRELPFLSIMDEILKLEGYNVKLIPFRSLCTWRLLLFRPNIVLINGLRHTYPYFISQVALPKKLFKSKIMSYYSEQVGYYDKSIAYTYKNKLIFDNVDFHIGWGPRFCKDLLKEGVEFSKLWYIGSMQYDISFYEKRTQSEIKKDLSIQYDIPYDKSWILYADNIIREYQPNDLYEQRRMDSFDVISQVAQKNPQSIIIYRPHPETSKEEMSMIKDYFKNQQNIIFNNSDHLYYWMCAINASIVWCSTSSLQAMFLNKPVLGFMTSDRQNLDRYWYKGILPLYESYSELSSDLNILLEGNMTNQEQLTLDKRTQYVKDWYFKQDGKSYNRMIYLMRLVQKSKFIPLTEEAKSEFTLFKILKILYFEVCAFIGDLIKKRNNDRNILRKDIIKEKGKYDFLKYKHQDYCIIQGEDGKYLKVCQKN